MNTITHLQIIKVRRCIHNNNRDLRKLTIQDICKKHLAIRANPHNNNILTINNRTKDIYMSNNKRDNNSKLNKIKTRLYINRYYNNNNNNNY